MTIPMIPAFVGMPELNRVYNVDALTLLRAMPTGSVDAVITDPPYGYGKTNAVWDSPAAPFDISEVLDECLRVTKKRGAVCWFAAPPFSAYVIIAGAKNYRYSWYCEKSNGSNFGQSHHQPLRVIEEVLVFSNAVSSPNKYIPTEDMMHYYPQMVRRETSYNREKKAHYKDFHSPSPSSHSKYSRPMKTGDRWESWPRNLINMRFGKRGLHPTQKPEHTCEYLVSTYTRVGMLVLDPFMGSGTTCIAARNLGRYFMGCDLNADYVAIAQNRLALPYTPDMFIVHERAAVTVATLPIGRVSEVIQGS